MPKALKTILIIGSGWVVAYLLDLLICLKYPDAKHWVFIAGSVVWVMIYISRHRQPLQINTDQQEIFWSHGETTDVEDVSWPTMYDEGLNAARKGNYICAIDKFSKCIVIDDKNPVTFVYRALAYYNLKKYEQALSDVHRALIVDAAFPNAYSTKALIEWSMGDLQAALADYDKAISLDSKSVIDLVNRGQVKRDTGDLEGAIGDFKNALNLDPSNLLGQQCLGICEVLKGSPEGYRRFVNKRRLGADSQ